MTEFWNEVITEFTDSRFKWLNNPKEWNVIDETGELEGSKGDYNITSDTLTIIPPAFKDYWSRTYYSPLLIKSDASALVCTIPNNIECTVSIDFEFIACAQFDQAGILIYLDNSHWIKCGIEFCDGKSLLSVVVCNVFSDWSTQPWPTCSARLRVHKILQSSSVLIEAAPIGSDDFHFIRIAHLSSKAIHKGDELTDFERNGTDEETPWQVGPFSASVTQQRGCIATFKNLLIGPRLNLTHSTDVSNMVH